MTWTTPSTQTTGTLITATIYNQQIIDNLIHLYDRTTLITSDPLIIGGTGSLARIGTFLGASWSNTSVNFDTGGFFRFVVPTTFNALSSANVVLISSATTTIRYNISINYGGAGQAYNTHTGSVGPTNLAVTANQLTTISITSGLASLAAGDIVGIQVGPDAGANAATVYAVLATAQFTRT